MTQPLEQASAPPPADPAIEPAIPLESRLAAVAPCWLDYLCVALVVWFSHFMLFRRFGFYEDDYYTYARSLTWGWPEMWNWTKWCWVNWPHGRPFGWTIMTFMSWAAFKIGGGPRAPFVLGYFIVAVNAVLMLRLLERTCPRPLPLIGALAFALFPGDTTRAFVVHNTLLQPAMLMALLSAHAWLSRRFITTYLLVALVLMTYESALLPFLFLPLLGAEWNWKTFKRLLVHGFACGGVIGALLVIRVKIGEGRVTEAEGDPELVRKIVTGFWIGARTSVESFVDRIGFVDSVKDDRKWSFVAWLVLALAAWRLVIESLPDKRDTHAAGATGRVIAKTVVVAVLMVLISYIMAFTHYPPDATYGRMTSVHLAASVGAAILMGAGLTALIVLFNRVRLGFIVALVAAVWFADLSQFGVSVQRGLTITARDQRIMWTQILRLCPDMTQGTFIILDDKVLQNTWYAATSSWADPLVLPTIFHFPANIRPPMFLTRLGDDWRDKLEWRGDRLFWKKPDPPYFGFNSSMELQPRNVIMLKQQWLEFHREDGTIQLAGKPFELKPKPTTRGSIPYEHGKFYPILIDEKKLAAP
jgi:hypothetical protein